LSVIVTALDAFCALPVTAMVEVPAGVAPTLASDLPLLHPKSATAAKNKLVAAINRVRRRVTPNNAATELINSREGKSQKLGGKFRGYSIAGLNGFMIPVV
jgi:hypothetical protein